MPFKNISDDQHEAFVSALKAGQYNLLLGAGSSMDSTNSLGKLPSGDAFKSELVGLKKVSDKYSLQRVYGLLTSDEVESYVTNRFAKCSPGPTALNMRKYLWRRVFTWNIDDVIQAAYRRKGANQRIRTIHYSDEYVEVAGLSELPVIHLHGTVTSPEKGYVFSRDQYVSQLRNINPWMTVLAHFMQSEPMIISGTSLDEVDLDYYLSHRTPSTSREDRGPSIIVTKDDDAITSDICNRNNLLHFVGYTNDFFEYCFGLVPNPPLPEELVDAATRRLLPETLPRTRALSFYSDFELVPGVPSNATQSRFLYGHAPTWGELSDNADISRGIVSKIVVDVEKALGATLDAGRLRIVCDAAGTGKTTILRRSAYELARRGYTTLFCSALSRIDSQTAANIDLIDGPVIIVVDDFADQATAFAEVMTQTKKKDFFIIAGERGYRLSYLKQVFAGIDYDILSIPGLKPDEINALVGKYFEKGLVGNDKALSLSDSMMKSFKKDPIAVVCCRILNDFRPLEKVVAGSYEVSHENDVDRYIAVAISDFCFKGGVRYEVLLKSATRDGVRAQFDKQTPLPIAYSDKSNSFVIPENSIIADQVLQKVAREEPDVLLNKFIDLATALRPYVSRKTIKKRTPEARLAGRLFDFDDIVERFLKGNAPEFYAATKETWQWNSRYWEQVSLMKLSEFRRSDASTVGRTALDEAVQHARFAVALENHPFGLTTLSKMLMTQMEVPGYNHQIIFEEAVDKLKEAIRIEDFRSRSSIQPYSVMVLGTMRYLETGARFRGHVREFINTALTRAKSRFSKDIEFVVRADEVLRRMRFTPL